MRNRYACMHVFIALICMNTCGKCIYFQNNELKLLDQRKFNCIAILHQEWKKPVSLTKPELFSCFLCSSNIMLESSLHAVNDLSMQKHGGSPLVEQRRLTARHHRSPFSDSVVCWLSSCSRRNLQTRPLGLTCHHPCLVLSRQTKTEDPVEQLSVDGTPKASCLSQQGFRMQQRAAATLSPIHSGSLLMESLLMFNHTQELMQSSPSGSDGGSFYRFVHLLYFTSIWKAPKYNSHQCELFLMQM